MQILLKYVKIKSTSAKKVFMMAGCQTTPPALPALECFDRKVWNTGMCDPRVLIACCNGAMAFLRSYKEYQWFRLLTLECNFLLFFWEGERGLITLLIKFASTIYSPANSLILSSRDMPFIASSYPFFPTRHALETQSETKNRVAVSV